MAQQKNLVLRKKINEVLYDLMVKTVTDQVYNADSSKTLTTIISELQTSIGDKATSADLQALQTKFDNLIQDAPEAYDTLKEISEYISSHQNEYQALLTLAGNKVDKQEGYGLSKNDFTDELKTKLDELYDKATVDQKISALDDRITKVETASGNIENLKAENVKYTKTNGEETNLKAVLDDLLYVPISVSSMGVSVATTQEKGASLSNFTVTWAYNKDKIVSQSLNGANLPDTTQRTYTEAGPITANKTYDLSVNDGTKTASRSVSISFQNKVYYGVSDVNDTASVDSAFIIGLTGSKFATSKSSVGSISVNAEAGQYIFYAQPASFAAPVFNIGGFDTEFPKFATIDFTNASGYTESYNVYRSGQAGLGSTSATVK